MTNSKPTIVGAGLAGLLAAHAWPTARVLEAAPGPAPLHRALLRFRSDAVARLTGTEFRRVHVRKGIWSEGRYVPADIRVANLYARKVLGRVAGERSIWNLAPVDRFIAPETFYEQLVEQCGARIHWGRSADFSAPAPGPIISTAPLPVVASALGMDTGAVRFDRAPITVERALVRGADAFQTVYFPDPDTALYRASLTGGVLILEYAGALRVAGEVELAARAMGLDPYEIQVVESVEQKYGKITNIPDPARKELLFRLTHDHGVYSLGRFATWRNIILDDVVQDIDVIKRLMNATGSYDLRRAAAA